MAGIFSVRVATMADLGDIASLDATEYGPRSVDERGLMEWHAAYPYGAFVLEDRSRGADAIVGAAGIWPITAEAYEQLVNGTLDERDIGKQHIVPSRLAAKHRHWYLADIIVTKELRRRETRQPLENSAAHLLVAEALRHWMKHGQLDATVRLVAIQVGTFASGWIKKFELGPAKNKDGQEVLAPNGDRILMVEKPKEVFQTWIQQTFPEDQRGTDPVLLGLVLFGAVVLFFVLLHGSFAPWLTPLLTTSVKVQMMAIIVGLILIRIVRSPAWRTVIFTGALLPTFMKLIGAL